MGDPDLLLRAWRDPETASSLDLPEWDLLLRQARNTLLLATLASRLEEGGLLRGLPARVQGRLRVARTVAAAHERGVRWEVDRIQRAVAGTGAPLVLLKGAAYVMAGLPPARGRLFTDVDIMVPEDTLAAVEAALLAAGWEPTKLDEYDQQYYRRWRHELPPLRHKDRQTIVDVHHAIVPPTGRLHPDPRAILEAARPLGSSGLRVLAPADMVLHSAAHLFQEDLRAPLRDLTDLDALLRHHAAEGRFWDGLCDRARSLGMGRPLFYALRYTERFLGTPVPAAAQAGARFGMPGWPALLLMDALVPRAVMGQLGARVAWTSSLALWTLFVRAQWLRLPPLLLASHLLRKSLRRRAP